MGADDTFGETHFNLSKKDVIKYTFDAIDVEDIKAIIFDLKQGVDQCVDEEMDACSWGYEYGVLISGKTALKIIKLLEKELENETNKSNMTKLIKLSDFEGETKKLKPIEFTEVRTNDQWRKELSKPNQWETIVHIGKCSNYDYFVAFDDPFDDVAHFRGHLNDGVI